MMSYQASAVPSVPVPVCVSTERLVTVFGSFLASAPQVCTQMVPGIYGQHMHHRKAIFTQPPSLPTSSPVHQTGHVFTCAPLVHVYVEDVSLALFE